MVGRRGLNAFGNGVGPAKSKNKDGSNSYRPKPVAFRFQDASNKAMEDQRRDHIKNKLIDAVKGDELETFRKNEDEVSPPSMSPRAWTTTCFPY